MNHNETHHTIPRFLRATAGQLQSKDDSHVSFELGTDSKPEIDISHIQEAARGFFEKSEELETGEDQLAKVITRTKAKCLAAKVERYEYQGKLLELIIGLHRQCVRVTSNEEGSSFDYASPLKEEIEASRKNGKARTTQSSPYLAVVKVSMKECPAPSDQAAWTRNNKIANAVEYIDKQDWSDVVGKVREYGGRDKLAALCVKARKAGKQDAPQSDDTHANRLASLFEARPGTAVIETAMGDNPIPCGLVYIRHVPGEPAQVVPLPSDCLLAASKAVSKAMNKQPQ